jgi:Polysaccharide deacetylase
MIGTVSLHERFAALLDRTGALDVAIQVRRRIAPFSTISIVSFHRIADIADDDPFDPEVVDATPAQFRRHVETLARIGTPIGMATLIGALDGAELPPNPVMITFDDGYRSCRDVALPILRELGVPVTLTACATSSSAHAVISRLSSAVPFARSPIRWDAVRRCGSAARWPRRGFASGSPTRAASTTCGRPRCAACSHSTRTTSTGCRPSGRSPTHCS